MTDCCIEATIAQQSVAATVEQQEIAATMTGGRGPAGPPGPAGQVADYVFTQASPSALWTINHNLGRKPLVSLLTVGGVLMQGDVLHVSDNQVQASFATIVAGTARLL